MRAGKDVSVTIIRPFSFCVGEMQYAGFRCVSLKYIGKNRFANTRMNTRMTVYILNRLRTLFLSIMDVYILSSVSIIVSMSILECCFQMYGCNVGQDICRLRRKTSML